MKMTLPTFKPRNPLALAARQRVAGAHQRSASALRQQARRALHRELQHLRHSP
jgi:hypothetical protein